MPEIIDYVVTAKDGASAAFRSAQNAAKDMDGQIATLKRGLLGLGGALGIMAFKGFMDGLISSVAALDDMAEVTGATVEELSKLQQVAKIGGHDMGFIQEAAVKLTKGLSNADEETKSAGKALAALGIDARDSAGNLRSSGDIIFEMAKKLDVYADSTSKTALLMDTFGKTGAKMNPVLKDIAEAGELVAKVTAEQAAQSELYEKTMRRLNATKNAYFRTIGMEAIPVMTAFATAMLSAKTESDKVGDAIKDLKKDNTLAEWAVDAGRSLAVLVDVLRAIPVGIKIIGSAFGAVAKDIEQGLKFIDGAMKTRNPFTFKEGMRQTAEAGNFFQQGGAGKMFDADVERLAAEYNAGSFAARFDKALAEVRKQQAEPKAILAYSGGGKADKSGAGDKERAAAERAAKAIAEGEEQAAKDAADAWKFWEKEQLADFDAFTKATEQQWKQVFESIDQEQERAIEQGQRYLEAIKSSEKEAARLGEQIWAPMESALERMATSAADLSDILKGVLQDIAKVAFRAGVTDPLGNAVKDAIKGSDIGKSVSGFFGGLFGGGKADGGPTYPGTTYLVGERGPELWTPSSGGSIVPNGGGGGASVTIHLNAIDTQSGVAFLAANQRVIRGIVEQAYVGSGRRSGMGA